MADVDSSTPLYSIGVVKEMTGLTGRQIRYYEESDLIKPARTEGNQRIYSQDDIERLNEIKELLDIGLNIAGVKEKLGTVTEKEKKTEKKVEKEATPIYNSRPLTKFSQGQRGLTSLYPVSNRAQLMELLDQRKKEQEKKEEE
ncbi:MerR family transcriptional regulator [Natroniella acetigena]|uniref:MerR family transcriptional regulator n=1 Tax=Natroniella acetigena TaxID=52004 RepID=UPI00200AD34A|nr:MerR family transcriptional regulator [Natroniella acetigena]MCK8826748.1 MerR family transcriptional regulator [Natroniella acetigena]